jgi:hypothetical protein
MVTHTPMHAAYAPALWIGSNFLVKPIPRCRLPASADRLPPRNFLPESRTGSRKPEAGSRLLQPHPAIVRIRRIALNRQPRLEAGKHDRVSLEGSEYILLHASRSQPKREHSIAGIGQRVRRAVLKVGRIPNRSEGAAGQCILLTVGDRHRPGRVNRHCRLAFRRGTSFVALTGLSLSLLVENCGVGASIGGVETLPRSLGKRQDGAAARIYDEEYALRVEDVIVRTIALADREKVSQSIFLDAGSGEVATVEKILAEDAEGASTIMLRVARSVDRDGAHFHPSGCRPKLEVVEISSAKVLIEDGALSTAVIRAKRSWLGPAFAASTMSTNPGTS